MTGSAPTPVVIVGAGLAGLATSALLSRAGFCVKVVEARETISQQTGATLVSINLALSARGIQTLEALGLTREVMRASVPMYGRRIHFPDGRDEFQAYDLLGRRAIHSVRRADLWHSLYEAARSSGVDVCFDARCTQIDGNVRTITLSSRRGGCSTIGFGALIGGDGAHSVVRRALVESGQLLEEIRSIRHGFLELCIPAPRASALDPNALHIWPRGDNMLVALPNIDGSFTATLFLPLDGAQGSDLARVRESLPRLFDTSFTDAAILIDRLAESLAGNPLGRIVTTRCRPWGNGESVLLIGDAAHAMPPFYGQGMNCALEDCRALMDGVERFGPRWSQVFEEFERIRRPDADAITLLSERNYIEMSRHVVENEFKQRREIERALSLRFPHTFKPLYSMIAFSTMPYAEALARGGIQAQIVERLVRGLERGAGLDLEADWIQAALASAGDAAGERAVSA